MKIAYYSDLHIDMAGKSKIALPYDKLIADNVDVIVLAGDLSNRAYETAKFIEETLEGLKAAAHGYPTDVIFVPGNHEFYKTPIELSDEIFMEISRRYTNFHYLTSDKSPVYINDDARGHVAFIGDTLWTDFRLYGTQTASMDRAQYGMSDYSCIWADFYGGDKWTARHSRDHHCVAMMNIVDSVKEIRRISSTTRIVAVSHHAPTYKSIHDEYKKSGWMDLNPAYASSILDADGDSFNPLLANEITAWIHGHVHNTVDVMAESVRVVSNPRGYTLSSYERYTEQNENSEFVWDKYLII